MQYLKLEQKQQANQYQLQSAAILQMSTAELISYLQKLSLENPVIELNDVMPSIDTISREKQLSESPTDWNEFDRLDRTYAADSGESFHPLMLAKTNDGLTETLYYFLTQQLPGSGCDARTEQAVCYLAACLDDDGYLRIPIQEISQSSVFSEKELQSALTVLQSLEPAGVGASTLSQCLQLQLQRIGGQEIASAIVADYLEQLSRGNVRIIAKKLGLDEQQVLHAQQVIRSLDPRPGAAFQKNTPTVYIQPDFYIEQQNGILVARPAWDTLPPFRISHYYAELLKLTNDPAVKTYLTEKLQQAESLLRSFSQRKHTLMSCMEFLLANQKDFFLHGPDHLHPLMMTTAAKALNVSVSTVSRAMRMKYLQCSYGTYPLSFFFPRDITSAQGAPVSSASACALLHKLVDSEDAAHPLSDQKLAALLAQQGCAISRRTVAKYRDSLGIPNASLRRRNT